MPLFVVIALVASGGLGRADLRFNALDAFLLGPTDEFREDTLGRLFDGAVLDIVIQDDLSIEVACQGRPFAILCEQSSNAYTDLNGGEESR